MASSTLDTLVNDMGFDKERAEMAIQQTGGELGQAIDWLSSNEDKSLDEIKASTTTSAAPTSDLTTEDPAEGATAQSLLCKECNKQFRSHAAATAHAERTGHTDFEESVQEVAPLTEEQKKEKLVDLRAKLAEKRSASEMQDKEERKKNEQIRMKSTKETQDLKEDLKKKEQLKQADAKRRERQEDIAAKERIRAKIAADKEERRLKIEAEKAARAGTTLPTQPEVAASTPAPAQPTSKPASAYTETRLRLQTKSKGNIMLTLPVDTTLYEVTLQLEGEHRLPEIGSFMQGFPKKVFERTEERTLKELGLVPSASLVVQ